MTKLTIAMINQLIGYAETIDNEGCYWGNRKQFWERHKKIMAWLNEKKAQRTLAQIGGKDG